MAGHRVSLVCTKPTADLINREGTIVRMPIKGREGLLDIASNKLSGTLSATTPEDVDPGTFDLIVLGMQEAQYGAGGVRASWTESFSALSHDGAIFASSPAWPRLAATSEDSMHTNHARAIIFSCTLLVLTMAAPSHAQGFISPLIGYDFGGNSGCPEITNCEDKRTNVGVALGSMGTILGFEEEFADAKNFFGSVGTLSSSVITIMSNIMIVPAVGPVHPYLLAGLGLMKTHVEFTRSDVLSTTNNGLAWDVGGGVTVLFTPHFGVRGDIRHFHSAKSFTIPFVGITPTDENLTFGRASAALVLAF